MKDPWALPEKIGRYKIRKLIGRGSMGVVYLANDAMLGRRVALKTFSLSFAVSEAERRDFEQRFLREAAVAGQLSHPGILLVYDVGQEPESGLLYMALEYLLGKPLDALVSLGQPLEWREALRTVAQVAEALQHAHSRGILHRDIKPGNIMILESGEPKVLDFGIARLPADKLTSAGRTMGSPAYMSPEQVAGRKLDQRTDIFSLGAVLHELLTGERAFRGTNAVEIMGRVVREDPPAPSTRNPGISPQLDSIVARCLAKLPENRYADGTSLAEDIANVLAGSPPRHAPTQRPGGPTTARLPIPRRLGPTDHSELTDPDIRERLIGGLDHDPSEPPPPRVEPPGSRPALPLDQRVSLAILSGGRAGEVLRLDVPRIVIGRLGAAGVDVELPDPLTSRAHAALEVFGESVLLRDLDSTNGTWADGRQILRLHELRPGDVFEVGRTRLQLMFADPPEEA